MCVHTHIQKPSCHFVNLLKSFLPVIFIYSFSTVFCLFVVVVWKGAGGKRKVTQDTHRHTNTHNVQSVISLYFSHTSQREKWGLQFLWQMLTVSVMIFISKGQFLLSSILQDAQGCSKNCGHSIPDIYLGCKYSTYTHTCLTLCTKLNLSRNTGKRNQHIWQEKQNIKKSTHSQDTYYIYKVSIFSLPW